MNLLVFKILKQIGMKTEILQLTVNLTRLECKVLKNGMVKLQDFTGRNQ